VVHTSVATPWTVFALQIVRDVLQNQHTDLIVPDKMDQPMEIHSLILKHLDAWNQTVCHINLQSCLADDGVEYTLSRPELNHLSRIKQTLSYNLSIFSIPTYTQSLVDIHINMHDCDNHRN
jgi:hypothetical protein